MDNTYFTEIELPPIEDDSLLEEKLKKEHIKYRKIFNTRIKIKKTGEIITPALILKKKKEIWSDRTMEKDSDGTPIGPIYRFDEVEFIYDYKGSCLDTDFLTKGRSNHGK